MSFDKRLWRSWVHNLINLIFPFTCVSCGRRLYEFEDWICTSCWLHLPKTGFETYRENPLEKVFWGRIPVYSASSFLFFSKENVTQKIIHELKYKGNKEIGEYFGNFFGLELKKSKAFMYADYIVPVPLHPKRQKKRGYNQSEMIAAGMAESMKIPVLTDALLRNHYTETQTRKSRTSRWENVEGKFIINPAYDLSASHVILVDDVITTGATIESCGQPIVDAGARLSVCSIGFPFK